MTDLYSAQARGLGQAEDIALGWAICQATAPAEDDADPLALDLPHRKDVDDQ